ncbi:hypothetical protein O181_123357 [Austropuccinia psidii MF-1]|uniref:Uncharacterized protein n=1 Tax=Austropuccinia psidii MF-1 TaxID=1389203 RepID=A0A9Q3Q5C1_9BASI|nr:hypothetical protein [Austropuccinia psidii MF-1]
MLAVPSQHASNTSYHPYAASALLTCLQCPPHTGLILTLLKPPQDETMMLLPISTPAFSSLPLTIITLLQRPQDMPPTPPLTPLMPNPLSAAYHPYAQVWWLVGVHGECNQGDMLSGHLCQQVLRGNWEVYSKCCG